jgi:uncharacterized membrane protein SirB2
MGITLLIFATLASLIVLGNLKPVHAAWIGSIWTFICFYLAAKVKATEAKISVFKEDRFWAGILAGCAIYMLYYFF